MKVYCIKVKLIEKEYEEKRISERMFFILCFLSFFCFSVCEL